MLNSMTEPNLDIMHMFYSQDFFLYKLLSVSPRINLYLYSGNYGELC